MVWFLHYDTVMSYTDWFCYVQQPLLSWGKSHLAAGNDTFNSLLDSVGHCVGKDIDVCIHKRCVSAVKSLPGVGIGVKLAP